MSFDRLISKIISMKNPTVAGLDPKLDYVPAYIRKGFFEEDGELVVLDFKTDHITHAQLAERREHYRSQLESYAAALERIMGMRVKEKLLYFFSIGECSAL